MTPLQSMLAALVGAQHMLCETHFLPLTMPAERRQLVRAQTAMSAAALLSSMGVVQANLAVHFSVAANDDQALDDGPKAA